MRSKENTRDLLIELVKTDFSLRYNNSILGFLWVLIKPFVIFSILYLVFSQFFGRGADIDNYPLYLLLGIVLYQFFSEGTINGLHSILGKSHIILKVNFPKEIAVIASTIIAIINFIINLIIFSVFGYFFGAQVTVASFFYFLFILVMMYLLILTLAFFISILFIKLRDLEHIWELGLQLLFYATPIIYPMSLLSGFAHRLISLNPLTRIILSAREALIFGKVEFVTTNLILISIILPAFFVSIWYFKKNVKSIAEQF